MRPRTFYTFALMLAAIQATQPGIAATTPAAASGSPPILPAITASSGVDSSSVSSANASVPDEPVPDAPQAQTASPQSNQNAASANQPAGPQQTKRILFIIPNFRSVSADVKLPPTTSKEKLKIFLNDSFDYSAFVEVAILAGLGEYDKSEPEFRTGAPGYARYYWHSFADNTDGNLMTEYLVPLATREDPRYYTLGHGGLLRRSAYSVSRLFVTRNNQGNATPNFSEIVGNGAAAGVSNLYYPGNDRTWTKTGQRWFLEVGIDGLSNLVKEFWPDVNAKLFHDKY
jgi:hypothetical protein